MTENELFTHLTVASIKRRLELGQTRFCLDCGKFNNTLISNLITRPDMGLPDNVAVCALVNNNLLECSVLPPEEE